MRRFMVIATVCLGCGKPPAATNAGDDVQGDAPVRAPEAAPKGDPAPDPAKPSAPAVEEEKGDALAETKLVVGTDPCKTDEDCVKNQCCHATGCVSKAKAPDCSNAVCTLECRVGTLGCGGGCKCVDGKCGAELWMGLPQQPGG